jgi:hypothetical protein
VWTGTRSRHLRHRWVCVAGIIPRALPCRQQQAGSAAQRVGRARSVRGPALHLPHLPHPHLPHPHLPYLPHPDLHHPQAVGQLFIFHTIKVYGPLIFATIQTVRQLISIFNSIVQFGHPINSMEVVGIVVVFFAISLQIFLSWQHAWARHADRATFFLSGEAFSEAGPVRNVSHPASGASDSSWEPVALVARNVLRRASSPRSLSAPTRRLKRKLHVRSGGGRRRRRI